MPTILIIGNYSFHFYSSEGLEPPHIHIRSGNARAKFWLDPVIFATSSGFRPYELRKLEKIVKEHEQLFTEAWNEYFET